MLPFPSGPFGPFFQVATAPPQLPNSCWQLSCKRWPHVSYYLQALERGRRHFGARCRAPKTVQVLSAEAARLLVEGLQARDQPLSKGKSKVSSMARTSSSTTFCGSWRCLRSTSATQHATLGPICTWAAEGARRQGMACEGSEAHETRHAATEDRGVTGSDAGVLWGSEVLGFTPTQQTAGQPRTERSHNDAGPRPAGAKNVDPVFRHH